MEIYYILSGCTIDTPFCLICIFLSLPCRFDSYLAMAIHGFMRQSKFQITCQDSIWSNLIADSTKTYTGRITTGRHSYSKWYKIWSKNRPVNNYVGSQKNQKTRTLPHPIARSVRPLFVGPRYLRFWFFMSFSAYLFSIQETNVWQNWKVCLSPKTEK